MMQLAGQLRAPRRFKDAASDTAPEDDEGQRLLRAAGAACKRRCHWRRGHKFQAAVERASDSHVGEQMISNDQRKQLGSRIKTNKSGAKEGGQHEEDAANDKPIVNLSHSEQMDEPPLNELAILKRPQKRSAATARAFAIGTHLRRLKLPFVLVALLVALSGEASRVSRRSISDGGQAYNELGGGARSRDKQAAAELVARQLLTSYYRNKILSQHMAQLSAGLTRNEAQPQQQAFQPETVNQHQIRHLNFRPQKNGLDASNWTTSGELMPPANSLQELPVHSRAPHREAASEQHFIAYQPATVAGRQTGATLPVPGNSLVGHEPMHQQQQQLTTPTLNKQLPPPTSYEFSLAPTKALQLEPEGAASEHVASIVQPAPFSSHQPSKLGQVAQEIQPAGSIVRPHAAKAPTANTSARNTGGESTRNGRQYKADSAADTSSGESSPPAVSSKFDQSQEEPPAALVSEKGVEPRQRRRMFNRILKKAEWNHLFVELSKVFVRYFLDLALKDIIGKQSGGTSSSSDSSSSSSTSGRKKLDAQSELTDLLKDFVKTAISNM